MNWLDRCLTLLEILILLRMLRMDTTNSQAIQKFLRERELWYSRRAQLKLSTTPNTLPGSTLENKKALDVNPEPNETVIVLEESENEQTQSQ